MYWVCPDCNEEFDWATDGAVRCVMCGRTSAEVRGKYEERTAPPVMAWLCVPCGGTCAQPADDDARCFKCHRTFAGLVAAGLMPKYGTLHETPLIEPPPASAKPIRDPD